MNRYDALHLAIEALERGYGTFYDNWYRASISVQSQDIILYMKAQEEQMKRLKSAIEGLKRLELEG